MDIHKAVFESEGLAKRQLVELRSLMSVLWSSSSDMIVLSIKHELKCLTLFSPAFTELLTGKPVMNAAGEHQALVMEIELERVERNTEYFMNATELGAIGKAYYVDASDCNFELVHKASVESRVEPDSFHATIGYKMLREAWNFVSDPKKMTSPLVPYEFKRPDGTNCSCEMKILPHAENGMVAVVRDVSERFRRFEAERRAEAEVMKRQKESQSVSATIFFPMHDRTIAY